MGQFSIGDPDQFSTGSNTSSGDAANRVRVAMVQFRNRDAPRHASGSTAGTRGIVAGPPTLNLDAQIAKSFIG